MGYVILYIIKKKHFHINGSVGAPGGIRIPDLSVRSRMLYPAKLLVHIRLIL
jgi:hypothetical protein